ncbi:MAG: P-loop NTPase [Alphaproteobacteria bacterium]
MTSDFEANMEQDSCSHDCKSCSANCASRAPLANNNIKHKIVVLSGKGGVGKSTVAVNLATSLMLKGQKVGILDVDIHGPSVPTMLGLEKARFESDGVSILPASVGSLKVASVGFLLEDQDDAIIWRGPIKNTVIKQFVNDVSWGDLDCLVIDCPPGTGDEALGICEQIKDIDGVVIVTTPQEVAGADVRKSINFCLKLGLKVLGVVENMSGFVCPHCGEITEIFKSGGGEKTAAKFNLPLFAKIPVEPNIGKACDDGKAFVYNYGKTETAKIFENVAEQVISIIG